jgi:peptide/nickel transport system permease protein
MAIGFVARRVLFALALVFLASSASLLLARLAPGDYVTDFRPGLTPEDLAAERRRLGLDRPFLQQYGSWLVRAVTLDLGMSFKYERPVRDLVTGAAGWTALLASASLLLGTLVGLPLGVFTGSRRGGLLPRLVKGASVLGVSVPPLITSLVLLLVAARTGWLPIGGAPPPEAAAAGVLSYVASLAWHLALPALALALPLAAMLERLQSQSLNEALHAPWILAARARGVPRDRLVWRHGLRPALKPVIAVYGLVIGSLFSGSFAVEIVTGWPGLGRLLFDAIGARDTYLVAGCAAAGAVFLACGTLLADLALLAADPRTADS